MSYEYLKLCEYIMLNFIIGGNIIIHDSMKDLLEGLYFAQEVDNQSLINEYAQDIARRIKDLNPNLDYNELLYQYGYSRDSNLKKR